MTVARVVGNVWATRKHGALKNMKLLLVQAMEGVSGKVAGETALAVDKKFGAGPGDTVLLMDEGNSARQILGDKTAPVRLIVCGIVDSVTAQMKTSKYH
jgi:ethanolamine utilization protein EutN